MPYEYKRLKIDHKSTTFLVVCVWHAHRPESDGAEANRQQTIPDIIGPASVWDRSLPVHIDPLMVCISPCLTSNTSTDH